LAFTAPPTLHNDVVSLHLLGPGDFEALHAVAADPLIWAQHPSRTRWQREVFRTWFEGALACGSAYRVSDATSGELIGSSRFCDVDDAARRLSIGYTFLARHCWGGRYNPLLKALMLDHAFAHVDTVSFQVGVDNRRSRIAMERLGAAFVGTADVAYYGEASHVNAIYEITRRQWLDRAGGATNGAPP
jgi:N-acetyltransferase